MSVGFVVRVTSTFLRRLDLKGILMFWLCEVYELEDAFEVFGIVVWFEALNEYGCVEGVLVAVVIDIWMVEG
jgi:hypothetical protein